MIDKNDPRLTAYALGELEAAEAATFETALAGETEAQGEVSAIRRAAEELRLALADESAPALTDGQREAIRASAARDPAERRVTRLRLLSWTLLAAAACVAVALFLNPPQSRGTGQLPMARLMEATSPAVAPALGVNAKTADLDLATARMAAAPAAAMTAPTEVGDTPMGAPAATAPVTAAPAAEAAPVTVALVKSVPPAAEAAPAESVTMVTAVAGSSYGGGVAYDRRKRPDRTAGEKEVAAQAPAAPALAFAPAAAPAPAARVKVVAADGGETFATAARGAVPNGVAKSGPDYPFRSATETPQSTFALAVDTSSYTNVRNFLTQGQLPPHDVVQIEGLVNHFRYGTGSTEAGRPFSVRTEVAACPWKPEQRLVRIAVNRSRQPAASKMVAAVDRGAEQERAESAGAAEDVADTAADVRLQVDFSPARVAVYRLIGNESAVATLQPNEETGVIAAIRPGQTVNAFYQVIPAAAAVAETDAAGGAPGQTPALALAKSRQRRAARVDETLATADNLLTVSLRWTPADARDPGVLDVAVPDRPQAWERTSRDMQFGSAVVLFGMLLRQSPHAAGATFDTVLALATPAAGRDLEGERAEFLELVRQARTAQPAAPQR